MSRKPLCDRMRGTDVFATLLSYWNKGALSPHWLMRFSVAATERIGFRPGERCNLYWDPENQQIVFYRGGHQRSVSANSWESGKSWSAKIAVTTLLRLYDDIPRRERVHLPVDVVGNEVFVDLGVDQDSEFNWREERFTEALNVDFEEGKSSILRGFRAGPVLKKVFDEAARREGLRLYSWAREALVKYVEDYHPDLLYSVRSDSK